MAPSAPRTDLEAWAVRAAGGRDPAHVRDELRRYLTGYLARRRDPLAQVSATVDGKAAPSLVGAFANPDLMFETANLEFTGGPPPGPRWDYLLRFRTLRFDADGSVEVHLAEDGGTPTVQRAIGRFLVRERFQPETGLEPAGRPESSASPGLRSLKDFARALRTGPVTPISVVLLLYLSDRRVRVELDLTEDVIEPDIRAGRLGLDHYVSRSPRISHGVDAFVARGHLPVSASRLLEVLVETHGLTAPEAAATFGGIHEMANTALESLRARRLATFDATHGVYRARLDAFLTSGGGSLNLVEPLPPMAAPALRTSVSELLAAAESRATCPLCGEVLPSGPHGILCAKCAAEVGAARTERSSA